MSHPSPGGTRSQPPGQGSQRFLSPCGPRRKGLRLPSRHPSRPPVSSGLWRSPAPLQGQPSDSLVLPQDLPDVLHDLLVALGLHVHEHLLPGIWSRRGRKRGGGRAKKAAGWRSVSAGAGRGLCVQWRILAVKQVFT